MNKDIELEDVQLNRPLVSDNPSDWRVPSSVRGYSDLFDWWEALIATDGFRLPFDNDKADLLIYLATQYEILVAECYDGLTTVPSQARVRTVVRSALHEGLTISQVAILFGTSPHKIVADLYCNVPNFDSNDIEARLCAEAMVRNGATVREICAATNLTNSQVVSFCSTINVSPTRNGSVTCPKPREARDLSMRMRREGYDNKQISEHLRTLGYDVPPATISKWWSRHGGEGVV